MYGWQCVSEGNRVVVIRDKILDILINRKKIEIIVMKSAMVAPLIKLPKSEFGKSTNPKSSQSQSSLMNKAKK